VRMRADDREIYSFGYVDESGTSERFFGCGLLVHGPGVSGREGVAINERLARLKERHGMTRQGDFGWKKVPSKPGKYLDFYRTCIDGFMARGSLAFHALVVDTRRYRLDSRKFFRGSKDHGIDAFAYHLVRARVLRFWRDGQELYIRFDQRQRPDGLDLVQLRDRLRKAVPESGFPAPRIRVRSVSGDRHPLLRLCDVLLGCVTADLNAKTTRKTKLALIDHLSQHLGRSPGVATPPSEKKFNVWHFEVQKPA